MASVPAHVTEEKDIVEAIVATHANRTRLFEDAAKLIVENAYKYYRPNHRACALLLFVWKRHLENDMSLRSISINSNDGLFSGMLTVMVGDTGRM
ncbi:hypothetical protein D0T60_18880, partial [Bacteroides sp. 224]|nr:hypothetical protein [Bacteroides sp. 224]